MKVSEHFEKEIGYIKNPILREIVIQALDNSPECIVEIPASSSGRYHPAYSLGEGGLMRHIKAAVGIAHSMIETEIYTNLTECTTGDVAYAALILHDCCKPDDTPKHSTRFDHPLKGAELFVNTAKEYIVSHSIDKEDISFLQQVIPQIKDCIASHMGQWTTDLNAKGIVLPKPKNNLEQFVHICDYLASRKYLLFDFDVYDKCDR